MVNTNLVDDDGLVYYLIKKDGRDVCQVFGKHTAKAIVTELNSLINFQSICSVIFRLHNVPLLIPKIVIKKV